MINDLAQKNRRRSVRKRMTVAERTLWNKLRSRHLMKFKFGTIPMNRAPAMNLGCGRWPALRLCGEILLPC